MSRSWIAGFVLAWALCLALTAPVFAGGWSVVTLDDLPRGLDPNRPARIGFMVRQHGVTPVEGLSPRIELWQSQDAERVEITASPEGRVGHYAATINLPSPGTWLWSIDAFGLSQRMPALTVGGVTGPPGADAGTASPMRVLGLAILGLSAGAALALARKRNRLATGLLGAVALTGAVGIVAWRAASAEPDRKSGPQSVAEGQALFVAKGCVVCHAHATLQDLRADMGLGTFSVGPDLSGKSFSTAYLASWLENPQATKPSTMMPDLDLSPTEIDALTAFINAEPDQ